jgi:hypothetical protein
MPLPGRNGIMPSPRLSIGTLKLDFPLSPKFLSSPLNHQIPSNPLTQKQIYFCKVGGFTLFNQLS